MSDAIYITKNRNDEFRWVGFDGSDADEDGNSAFGILLAKLRWDPVGDHWTPPPIDWLPETIGREICDIPHFRSTMWCLNARAVDALEDMLERAGEVLPLKGLSNSFSAFNCLERYNALDRQALETIRTRDRNYSIASTRKSVPLLRARIGDSDIFKIPEAISQTFVSERFRLTYMRTGLTGLEFYQTDVR
jgi:hypothetical protein